MDKEILGWSEKTQEVPDTVPYEFRKEVLRDILAYLNQPRGDAMWLTGPTGSGKTSSVEQIAARLNWPVQEVTCTETTQASDLVGMYMLKSEQPDQAPSMSWQDGPLTKAMRSGHIFLINEVDLMNPGELSGLNEVLSGKPLTIAQRGGEKVVPHPMFRVFVTGNSNGAGDDTGVYSGVVIQNIAAMDRYRLTEVDYALPEVEARIIKMAVPEFEETLVEPLIRVANEVRNVFKGNDPRCTLSITFSTRTVIRWAGLAVDFREAPNALKYALERALLLRAKPEEKEAINQICRDVFGVDVWGE
jgi:cobaltochelatase CobS